MLLTLRSCAVMRLGCPVETSHSFTCTNRTFCCFQAASMLDRASQKKVASNQRTIHASVGSTLYLLVCGASGKEARGG